MCKCMQSYHNPVTHIGTEKYPTTSVKRSSVVELPLSGPGWSWGTTPDAACQDAEA